MQKQLNFKVEVEINDQWVHANVETLAEAKALLTAFEAVDATKACIYDDNIFLNKDATAEARAEFEAYQQACLAETAQWLSEMVAQGRGVVKNGSVVINATDL